MGKPNSIPQFVTAPVDEANAPQTIKKIAAIDCYLVQFMDAEGRESVRIVFKVPGSDAVFNLQETVGGSRIVANSSGWFRDQFNKMLVEKEVPNLREANGSEDGVGAF